MELIDGLQRTSSVLQFIEHDAISQPELVLVGCDIIEDLNGLTFSDLPLPVRMKVKRSPIRATIINKSGDEFVKYEMFKRLNTGGSMLSAQEIRNCSSRMVADGDAFYDAIQEMAKYRPFISAISRLPDTFKEKRADEELILRFFAISNYRDAYKGNIEEWLDGYMEKILFKEEQFDLAREKARFESVFSLIDEKAGDKAFTRFNDDGQPTGRLAPAYYEAAICAFMDNVETIRGMTSQEVIDVLKEAYSSQDFIASTGPGANTIPKLHSRIESVSRHFRQ